MHKSTDEELYIALTIIVSVFFVILLILFFILYNYIVGRRQRSSDILQAIFKSQELERDNMARELHDELGSKISIIKFTNEFILAESLNAAILNYAQKNSQLIDELANLTRFISRDYASSLIIDNGLQNELTKLIRDCVFSQKVTVDFQYQISDVLLTDEFTINIYRVIQELLNNSLKHSSCQKIAIRFYISVDLLYVIYSDNGIGIAKQSISNGMGLRNVAGRVIAHKGILVSHLIQPGLKYIMKFKKQNILKHD